MPSSSGTLHHSDNSRFAESTTPKSGMRTPRRVQWASDDAVRVDGDPVTSPRGSVHELDEMGLDVRLSLNRSTLAELTLICSPMRLRRSGMPWKSTDRGSIFQASRGHKGEGQMYPIQCQPQPSSHAARPRCPNVTHSRVNQFVYQPIPQFI